jgi:hypothetical protein
MDRMAEFGPCRLGALCRDRAETVVLRNLPADRHRIERHAALRFQRPLREARPQHEAIERGIA